MAAEVANFWSAFRVCADEIQARHQPDESYDHSQLLRYLQRLESKASTPGQARAVAGLKSSVHWPSATVPSPPSRAPGREATGVLTYGLQRAIAKYEEAVVRGSEGGPFVVADYVPFLAFEKWYKEQESHWRIAFQFLDAEGGVALLYGDPSFLHEVIAGWFGDCLKEQVVLMIQGPVTSLASSMGSSRVILPTGLHKEPDFMMLPRKSAHKIPPWVGEIAYSNEPATVLKEELIQWTLPGGARIAYGVKVCLKKTREGTTADGLRLRFLERRAEQDDFHRDIDFSPDECTRLGDPSFQVDFPLATLFPDDKRLLHSSVTFDLFHLQGLVLELLENQTVEFVWHPRQASRRASQQGSRHQVKSPLLNLRPSRQMKKRTVVTPLKAAARTISKIMK